MNELLPFLSGVTMQMVFLISLGYIAYALCQRWFSGSSVGIRWCATCIIFCWFLSSLFSVLMSLRLFAPLPAAIAALIGFVLASRVWLRSTTCVHCFGDDVTYIRDLIVQKGGNIWRIALACFLLLSALLAIRTLALPILGWDSLTYHGVKAGLWVQAKGWTILNAPGGWESYRSFFGGGEVFTAWAMLFLHTDLLAGIPDLFFWGLVGLATAGLAKDFGLPRRSAVRVGMAFLCAPALSRMIGSGYVDTCANAFLLCGILFLVRFGRSKQPADLCVAAAAFGLASSVKINMLATGILMALPAIALLVQSRWRSIQVLFLCLLGFAAPVVPWLVFNYTSTGYPLGCTPLSIGPIHLGGPPPNLVWALDRPDLTPYTVASEAKAMFQALRPFGLVLLLAVLGIPGMLLGVGRGRRGHILTVLLMASICGLYFSPGFSSIRLGWAGGNGRFLVPVIIMMAAAGLPGLQSLRDGTLLIEAVSGVSIIMGAGTFIQHFVLGQHRVEILFLALAAVSTVLVYYLAYRRRLASPRRIAIATALCIVALAGALYAFARFKDSFRIQAYSLCTTLHPIPRYWVAGLRALESERPPLRIAFTYGPKKISDRSFLAPFLGAYLNNRLLYVSPYQDGRVVPHHPEYLAQACPSIKLWLNALHDAGATHVLCLPPKCIELWWMQSHPGMFVSIAGREGEWGLFRIERRLIEKCLEATGEPMRG